MMFKTFIGPVEGDAAVIYLRPETAQGIFVNFVECAAVYATPSTIRHRPGRKVVPQRDLSGQLHLSLARVRADGMRILLPASHGGRVLRAVAARAVSVVRGPGDCAGPSAPARPRSSRTVALQCRHHRHGVSVSMGLGGTRGHCQPHRLRLAPAQ